MIIRSILSSDRVYDEISKYYKERKDLTIVEKVWLSRQLCGVANALDPLLTKYVLPKQHWKERTQLFRPLYAAQTSLFGG